MTGVAVKDRIYEYVEPETDPYADKPLRLESVKIELTERIIAVKMNVQEKGYCTQVQLKLFDELWLR